MGDGFYNFLEIAIALVGAGAAVYAGQLWLRAQKFRSVAEAKDEIIKLTTSSVIAWKERYEAERLEYTDYRARFNEEKNARTAKILQLTEENAGLKAKTDLSPMMEALAGFIQGQNGFMKELTGINSKILAALTTLEQRIDRSRGV